MIKITIEGPQDSGKTHIAEAIIQMSRAFGKSARICVGGKFKRMPGDQPLDVMVVEKQTKR